MIVDFSKLVPIFEGLVLLAWTPIIFASLPW